MSKTLIVRAEQPGENEPSSVTRPRPKFNKADFGASPAEAYVERRPQVIDEDFFWEGLDRGAILIQQCADCTAVRHPPAPMCSKCQSLKWQPVALSGKGRIFSWIVSKHPSRPDEAERTVLLVEMDEGVRMVGNLLDTGNARIGAPVRAVFRDDEGQRLLTFETEALPDA
jgi:hypothetical protein